MSIAVDVLCTIYVHYQFLNSSLRTKLVPGILGTGFCADFSRLRLKSFAVTSLSNACLYSRDELLIESEARMQRRVSIRCFDPRVVILLHFWRNKPRVVILLHFWRKKPRVAIWLHFWSKKTTRGYFALCGLCVRPSAE